MSTDIERTKAYNLVWNEISHVLDKLNKDGHSDNFVISVMSGMAAAAAVHMGCSRETFIVAMTNMFDSANGSYRSTDDENTKPGWNGWKQ